ncbi:MAG: elongation factor G [Deltaproteobacteria bacterium]|nr:elongation factor G [Deltaproteobacteria bacterium]
MKVFESKDIRNVGLIGHKACGKTSVAEAALWSAGENNRLGHTNDGTSVLDFEDEEHKRVMSVGVSVGSFEWAKAKINLLDTPGDGNFLKDTRVAMQATDGVVCVVSGKDGVEPMHERVMGWAQELKLARAIFISKIDAENSDFQKALTDVKENLCKEATALQIPIGAESAFKGVVDLLHERAHLFKDGDKGEFEETDIPADFKSRADEARNALIEDIAAADESLMEKYFEGTLTPREIIEGLSKAMAEGAIVPVLCGSGTTNRGVRELLDFVVESFPNPLARAAWPGRLDDTPSERPADPNGPATGLVFKTMVDQHAGRISVIRVLSGSLVSNTELHNAGKRSTERLGTPQRVVGKKLDAIERAPTGDIFAVAKLKDVHTGDTLSADGWKADTVKLSPPLIARALSTSDKGAEDKITDALRRIVDEDPGLVVGRDEQTGELLLSGSGQQHIEVAVEKMSRKFGVKCELRIPRIPYLETITAPVKNIEGKHKKQTGGAGQFGVCFFDLFPAERGTGFQFDDEIVGGAIPRQFIPSVQKGMERSLARGFIAGYPLTDLRVRLFDGKYHPVDSKDVAFQMAGAKGLKSAIPKARPVLLEPIMQMEIVVPEENMGDVMGDVNTRRGRVLGSETQGKYTVVKAQMPLAEAQTFEASLRAITQGRGAFTMEHGHMEQVPPHAQEKIIKESGFVASDEDE